MTASQTATADAKPKQSQADVLAKLKTKLRAVAPEGRHEAYEALEAKWAERGHGSLVSEAYESLIAEQVGSLTAYEADEFAAEYDGDEFVPTDEDESYGVLLGEFRDEEGAA